MKTFKYKLYDSKKNRELGRVISLNGRAKNTVIALHRKSYKLFGKKKTSTAIQAHLAKKKQVYKLLIARLCERDDLDFPEFDAIAQRLYWKYGFLCDIPSQALQQCCDRVEDAYEDFFEYRKAIKQGKKTRKKGLPKFRSSRKYKSFTLKQAGWSYEESGELKDNAITLMGRKYKFHKSRPVEGNIRTVTVKRNALGEIFICFACASDEELKQKIKDKSKTKEQLEFESEQRYRRQIRKILMTSHIAKAIDFGMIDFLTFEDGDKKKSPEFLKRSIKELKVLSRSYSRKKDGSNNKERARVKLVMLHEKITHQRTEWARRIANEICKSFDGKPGFIFVEDLTLEGMKKLWGRKISDIAWGIFVRELTHIAHKFGVMVVKIPRFEKTSGVCLETGLIKQLELSDREWKCECGKTHDRDHESAKVIREAGLRLVRDISVRPLRTGDGKKRAA